MDEDDNNVDDDENNYDDMADDEESDIEDSESDTESTEDSSDDDDGWIDIWGTIDQCVDGLEGGELKEQLMENMKSFIKLCRSVKKDNVARAVLKELKRAQDDDEMKYTEALDHAIDKRKFLLFRAYKKWKTIQQEESEQ